MEEEEEEEEEGLFKADAVNEEEVEEMCSCRCLEREEVLFRFELRDGARRRCWKRRGQEARGRKQEGGGRKEEAGGSEREGRGAGEQEAIGFKREREREQERQRASEVS